MRDKSILKQSTASFEFNFSFSSTGCSAKAKEPSLSYYLTDLGVLFHGF